MLSDDEKAKIKAEEIYRSEVRDKLREKVNNKNHRVWTVLNSSIFLWFLSTVAVGGITYKWSVEQNRAADARVKSQKEIEAVAARTIQIDRLNLEIEGRLSQFLVDVEHMVQKPYTKTLSLKAPYTEEDIRKKWEIMKARPRNDQSASLIYQEFADRGIVSLIVELDGLKRESNIEEITAEGIAKTANPTELPLKTVAARIQSDKIFQDYGERKQDGFLPIWSKFEEQLMRGEWSTMFPYTDNKGSFPFA